VKLLNSQLYDGSGDEKATRFVQSSNVMLRLRQRDVSHAVSPDHDPPRPNRCQLQVLG